MKIAALDIGGANVKGALLDGPAFTLPFALWRRPRELPQFLSNVLGERAGGAGLLAVTMTGELCDCFETKAGGVRHILESVREARDAALPGAEVLVWRTDSRFAGLKEAQDDPLPSAAANWLALACFAAELRPGGRGILLDMGSTTTDIVPLADGRPAPEGLTDTERLLSGELVYTGSRRTPVCAVVRELPYRDRPCPVASELFATMLDVYLILGAAPEDPDDCDTADGREATRERARERLARMIGADRTSFSAEDAALAAQAAAGVQSVLVRSALHRVTVQGPSLDFAVIAGSGEAVLGPLTEGIARERIFLSRLLGPEASAAAPAVALARLAAGGNNLSR